jgi:hypothetical protein
MLYTTTMNVEQEIAAGKEHTKENIINNLNEKTNNKVFVYVLYNKTGILYDEQEKIRDDIIKNTEKYLVLFLNSEEEMNEEIDKRQ